MFEIYIYIYVFLFNYFYHTLLLSHVTFEGGYVNGFCLISQ